MAFRDDNRAVMSGTRAPAKKLQQHASGMADRVARPTTTYGFADCSLVIRFRIFIVACDGKSVGRNVSRSTSWRITM